LERIASFFVVHTRGSQSKFIRETASELFSAYDDFLDLLNNTEKRKHLDELKPGDEETDIVFKEARMMRKRFRLAIQNMFLHQDSPLYKHSIEKGVF
jgi:hypothetical protein